MLKHSLIALALAGAAVPVAAGAQTIVAQSVTGTRLDIVATGEVNRVPDLAIISAGVVTRADTATQAISQNAARIERVRAALARAGIAERDIQTTTVSLNPDYVYAERQPPRLSGYQASNQLTIRFRDIRNAGKILDALVAEGSNQISGPTLTIDKPEAALDEARARALAVGRSRAELYARSLGMRVARLVSVSEPGGVRGPEIVVMARRAEMGQAASADTQIVPGEQSLSVTLQMSFELQ
jgi:uncharacterized protein YggE